MASNQQQDSFTPSEISNINMCANLLFNAKRVVVFSGAGMSAESGIETFRGSSGLWTGIIGTVVLGYFGTPFGWSLTPGIAWSQYVQRFYTPIAKAHPNKGHYALAQLEKVFPHMSIITQNVDGLHQRAGSSTVYEVHGTVLRHRCISKGHIYDFDADDNNNQQQQQKKQKQAKELPTTSPVCKVQGCGSTLRPDCVLFTESLPSDDWSGSAHAVQSLRPGDVLIICGTSGVVYPSASLPEVASERGAFIIDCNLQETPFKDLPYYHLLKGPSGKMLPALVKKLFELKNVPYDSNFDSQGTSNDSNQQQQESKM